MEAIIILQSTHFKKRKRNLHRFFLLLWETIIQNEVNEVITCIPWREIRQDAEFFG